MQIWCALLEQSIYCDFATASARTQQDVSCKVAQQLSASTLLGTAQWLVVQQQQQKQQKQCHQHHSCTYAHPHNDKSRSNTKKQFSVVIFACCNLLFLAEVEINCLWVGFPNPDRLSLVSALSWASNWPSQGHNLFELKAQKNCASKVAICNFTF